MQILDVLRSAQGGAALANLGRAYGLDPVQAEAVATAVMPELSARLERNTLSRGGLADLIQALGHGHHEIYVDDPRAVQHPQAIEDGKAILDHVTGSKDKSRAIADHAALATGVPASIIKAMLPVIAGMMMGGLSKAMKGGLGEIMGRMGGGGQKGGGGGMQMPRMPELPGGGMGMPRQQTPTGDGANDVLFPQRGGQGGARDGHGGGGRNTGVRTNSRGGLEMPDNPSSIPNENDGSGIRRGPMPPERGQRSGSPLPLPGNRVPGIPGNSDNPYGDLAEILRRGLGLPGGSGPVVIPNPGGGGLPWPGGGQGGMPMPGEQRGGMPGGRGIELPGGNVGGGMLWNIVRSILGGAMGFQGGGVMSWLFRMVVMRYGWTILKTVLGRGMFGR